MSAAEWVSRILARLPRWVVVALGVGLVLLGLALALRPFRSLAVLVILIAASLVLAAVGELVGGRWPWGVLRGALTLAAAIALLLWPGPGLGALTLLLGAVLLSEGITEVLEGVRPPPPEVDARHRWAHVLGGAAMLGLAVLALAWRDVTLLVVAIVFGVRLVVLGFQVVRGSTGRDQTRSPRWRVARAAAAIVGVIALAVTGVWVQRGHPVPDTFYDMPTDVPAEPGRLLAAEPFHARVPEGATAWRILYTTTRDEGVPAVASGLVVTPDGVAGATPVVAWAHGTTGWAPGCAPSLLDEPFEAGALFVLDDVLEQGWTLVATDYVGLGTASPHPYVIGQGEGRSVLDAVRAARELDGLHLDDRTVVWGHSQGGHAALWTGMLASHYAPELRIDGVAALAPATDLHGLVQVVEESRIGTLFAVYVVAAYASVYPDVDHADYVRPGAQLLVREMAQRCLSERGILVSAGQALLLDQPIWSSDPTTGALGARLSENIPTGAVEAPLLIGQGLADELITPEMQARYVAGRCASGQAVDFRTYPGRDHLSLVAADSPAVEELLAWTTQRLEGEPAGDTC